MKQLIFSRSVLFVLASCGVYGQLVAPFHPPTPTVDNECRVDTVYPLSAPMHGDCLAVKEYMRYPSPLSPIGDGWLAMMGDEAAFHLSSIIALRPPLTAAQTLIVLDIVHNSFKMPSAIRSHADRKPEKSLALLKRLQATAVDQIVKERIATEVTFLTTLPTSITPVPILNLPAKPGVMPMRDDFPKP